MGRPTKLTPEIQAQLETMLGSNAPIATACDAIGLEERTFYAWMAKGKKAKSNNAYRQFYQAITRTRAVGELTLIQNINGAAAKEWRAAVFLLQIRRPEVYKPATRMEHTGAGGSTLPIGAPASDIAQPIIHLTIEAPREKNVTPRTAAA